MESSPAGTKETPRRRPGNVENLCRPYGTRQHFQPVHPALKRWAIPGCPDGASGNRVAHALSLGFGALAIARSIFWSKNFAPGFSYSFLWWRNKRNTFPARLFSA
jgi:hypothetical protein